MTLWIGGDLENSVTSWRVSVCARLPRRPLVVPLCDQLQHVLNTVHLGVVMMKIKIKMTLGTETRMIALEKKTLTAFLMSCHIVGEWRWDEKQLGLSDLCHHCDNDDNDYVAKTRGWCWPQSQWAQRRPLAASRPQARAVLTCRTGGRTPAKIFINKFFWYTSLVQGVFFHYPP